MTPDDLKSARATLGLTQAALARELGVSRSHVSHVEQGCERASTALCAHLRLLVKVAGGKTPPGTVRPSPAGS